ncbi:MAG: hypothetical protein QOC57_2036 [Ilumatobacteraceae bacterium]
MSDAERMKITDVRVLAALAHPVRLRILQLLLSVGERTATQCADVVDASPSACSYHLRHLQEFGLVARVDTRDDDAIDGRTRRWRCVASGFDFGDVHSTASPALVAASAAVIATSLEENHRLVRHYLSHVDEVSVPWQDVASFSTFALLVNVEELQRVVAEIDAIVRPLRQVTRDKAPPDAVAVQLSLAAFPRTDLG